MADIIQRTALAETDKRLALQNQQWGRVMDIDPSWQKIRIGIRYSTTKNGGYTAPPPFYIGLCSDTVEMSLDLTTKHFLGLMSDTTNWIGYPVSNALYYRSCRSVSGVKTTQVHNDYAYVFHSTQAHSAIFLEIQKGSPNYTINAWSSGSSGDGTASNVTLTAFLSQMESAAVSSPMYKIINAHTFAIDEAVNGILNTINLGWSGPDSYMEISEIKWARLL